MDNSFSLSIIGCILTKPSFFSIYSIIGNPQERLIRRGVKRHGDKIPVINLLVTGEGKIVPPGVPIKDERLLREFRQARDLNKRAFLGL